MPGKNFISDSFMALGRGNGGAHFHRLRFIPRFLQIVLASASLHSLLTAAADATESTAGFAFGVSDACVFALFRTPPVSVEESMFLSVSNHSDQGDFASSIFRIF